LRSSEIVIVVAVIISIVTIETIELKPTATDRDLQENDLPRSDLLDCRIGTM
jgi:hypothetical protein